MTPATLAWTTRTSSRTRTRWPSTSTTAAPWRTTIWRRPSTSCACRPWTSRTRCWRATGPTCGGTSSTLCWPRTWPAASASQSGSRSQCCSARLEGTPCWTKSRRAEAMTAMTGPTPRDSAMRTAPSTAGARGTARSRGVSAPGKRAHQTATMARPRPRRRRRTKRRCASGPSCRARCCSSARTSGTCGSPPIFISSGATVCRRSSCGRATASARPASPPCPTCATAASCRACPSARCSSSSSLPSR
mmetsp:Transcript_9746/g.37936  ORF Transcript_9746/g.37936 Transcript_9746/m.37936 type:complete len:247 (-) Transcript_9746:1066-1806(-)